MLSIFIFILGILLIVLNLKFVKKEENTFNEILKREENNNRDYDVEIIKIRKDMAETVLELQKEIRDLKEELNNIKNTYIKDDNKNIDELIYDKNSLQEEVISNINFSNKKEEQNEIIVKSKKQKNVKELLEEGLSDEEICKNLSIGKGEILLIKNLLKN